MAFYELKQNYIDGGYEYDATGGIGKIVFIEAVNADDANSKAAGLDLFFEDLRWPELTERNAHAAIPTIWGEPADIAAGTPDSKDAFIHYHGGAFQRVELKE